MPPASSRLGWGWIGELAWLPCVTSSALASATGFDPIGLAKPTEYLQMDLDQLDQNAAKNRAGGVIGKLKPVDNTPTTDSLQVR